MYDTTHPVYPQLVKIGREITQQVKPKAIVVFSAHWQSSRSTIEVNTAESTDLIYDFYGFPAHYYKAQFPHRGSSVVASNVISLLQDAGIAAKGVKRGLDHGVWASFSILFKPETNPVAVPIVQVSLFDTEDADQHYRLGQAISALREQSIQVVCSGMAVHNLRDLFSARSSMGPLPYTLSFDKALKEASEADPRERQQKLAELLERTDARKAHPSFEHLLPIHIAAGAAGDDMGKQIWTMPEGSMSWAMYRFGDLPSAQKEIEA